MFYGRTVKLMGRQWAVTVPGYDCKPERFLIPACDAGYRVSTGLCVVTGVPVDGEVGFARYGQANYENGKWFVGKPYSSSAAFLPVFVPVDENGAFDPHGTDGFPDIPFPFCVASLWSTGGETKPISMHGQAPRFSRGPGAKFCPVDIFFGDICGERQCFHIIARKCDGCLVACDVIVAGVSCGDLNSMGYFQRDLPVHHPYVAWIDGEPWEVRVPRYCDAKGFFGHGGAFIVENKALANRLSEKIYPLSVTAESMECFLTGIFRDSELRMLCRSAFCPACFFPDLIPLNPKTMKPDDSVLRDMPDHTMVRLGGFAVLEPDFGWVYSSNDDYCRALSYSEGFSCRFMDSPAEPEKRMEFVKLGDRLMSVSPVLQNISLWDAIHLGWADARDIFQGGNK